MFDDLANISTDSEGKKDAYRIFFVMKEFGYTIEEIKQMPITTYAMCLKFLEEDARKMKSKQKNRGRG